MSYANVRTQRGRILNLLIGAHGQWVPLPEIMACAAQYNARLLEARRDGYQIENKTETIDGVRHSWYRLVNSPIPPEPPKADVPTAHPLSGDWYEHQTGHPRPSNIGPLFDGQAVRS